MLESSRDKSKPNGLNMNQTKQVYTKQLYTCVYSI